MGRPGTAGKRDFDMENLTPKHMRCAPLHCPSVGRIDDGSLLIVGKRASMAAAIERVSVGEDEHAVIISPDLLSDYVAGEVAALKAENERLANALENLLARHCELVESGDCGFWDVEQEPEVVEARAALDASAPVGQEAA